MQVPTGRGPQTGYNRCNSTTEGPTSQCQTSFVNSASDLCVRPATAPLRPSSCLWGPSEPNSVVGDTEGSAVAWCTQPGHGTRVLPAGAITALQFIRTSAYVQVSGIIDQTKMNVRRHFCRSD